MSSSTGRRRAGLLIPLFSCPSTASWGIGDIGDIEPLTAWLAGAGQRILQLLPLNEMAPGQKSPYSAISAMAIDPIFISVPRVPDFEALGGEASLSLADRDTLADVRRAPRIMYEAVRRLKLDALLLKLPLAGGLVVQLSIAQATRSLATLLAGGITLVESWEIAAESITNRELRRRSSAILPMIREGRTFTESLEAANWVPLLAVDMVGIGERSGSLREMLEEVAVFYDAESEVRLEQLTTTLEPAILVVMGVIVVTILLAIYLPIIQSISGGTGITVRH